MEKEVHKRPAGSEKDSLGCIWSLISMFDFRAINSPQKLLQDRRHKCSIHAGTEYSKNRLDRGTNWERKPEGIFDVDKKKARSVTTSIKILIEEEMSRTHPPEKYVAPGVGRKKPDSGFGVNVDESHKRIGKNYKVASDHHANDFRASVDAKSYPNKCAYQSETPKISLNMPALMVEINHICQDTPMDLRNKTDPFSGCKDTDYRKDNLVVEFDTRLTDNLVVEFDTRLTEKNCILQKAQCNVTEAFPNQKSLDAELLNGNRRVQYSKDLMDALELPNVNKESLLKLLEDQDPLMLKHIQEFQNVQAGKYSELKLCENMEGSDLLGEEDDYIKQYEELVSHIHIQNASFWWKDKCKGSGRLKGGDHSLDRIVVLKPNLAKNHSSLISFNADKSPRPDCSLKHKEGSEKVASHFSFKEIKKKLRHAICESKKELLRISMDDALHQIPHGTNKSGNIGKNSTVENIGRGFSSKTTSTSKHIARTLLKREGKRENALKVDDHRKLNATAGVDPPYSEPIFYEEAKKHLTVMLDTGGRNQKMCAEQAPKTLRRLLSWSECNLLTPAFSPEIDKEPESPQKMIPSPIGKFMQETPVNHMIPLKRNIKSTQRMDGKQDDGIQVLYSHEKSGKDFLPKESVDAIETVDILCMEERDCLVVCSETNSTEVGFPNARFKEEHSNSSSVLDANEGRPQPVTSCMSISSKSLFVRKLEVPETLMETPERPSPVSVLESFFLDDVTSPGSTTSENAESSLHPRLVHFEERENSATVPLSDSKAIVGTSGEDKDAKFKYVQALLQASGISYKKLSKIWHLSESLLDPLLFDKVAISSNHLPDDPKLLFDCANEALVEISHRCFSCTPWLYIIKPDIRPAPVGRSLIQEVCKGIDQHIHWQFMPSLNQTIRKDLDCGDWMKLQCDTESTIFNMGDAILDDLVEETVIYLCARNHSKNETCS